MDIDFRKFITLLLIVSASLSFGQIGGLNKDWVSIGRNSSPVNPKFRGDAGIGPIEFIRVYQEKEGYLLAGSLHGGLFFSENGGDSWINSGSDAWPHTGCAWADFHPTDENVWFACSNIKGAKIVISSYKGNLAMWSIKDFFFKKMVMALTVKIQKKVNKAKIAIQLISPAPAKICLYIFLILND